MSTLIPPSPANPRREKLVRISRLQWYHWSVVGLSILLTFVAAHLVGRQIEHQARARFERIAEHNVELIVERLGRYEDALWGGVGAIRARGRPMTLDAWRAFAGTLDIDIRYPGINGIGIIHRVPGDDLADYVAAQRRTRPRFAIHPERVDDRYLPITFIEPESSNAQAVGLDMRHETNRLRGAQAARDTGLARITAPIVLVQDERRTPGFLFFAPFYRGDTPADETLRRERFTGLVYAPFIVERLMEGVLDKDGRNVGLRLEDGEEIIYDEHVASEADFDPAPVYRRVFEKELYGRSWTFDIRSTLAFRGAIASYQPLAILIGGLLINALLLALFLAMSRANRRAVRAADELTLELRDESARLERSNADLELFASVASHDLQEPLRAVGGFTRLIQQRYGGKLDAEADRYIGFTIDGVARMQLLLEELLAYARVGADEAGLEEVDSAAVCREVLDSLRSQLETCGGQVELGDLPTVRADRSQLMQLLQNLISNALKFRVDDRVPHVRVTALERDTDWCFSVHDNGLGIESKYFDKVFVMFQRLHTRAALEGSGIGLAVCKKIVLRHGGAIWIESEVGVGTTVHFTLDKLLGTAVVSEEGRRMPRTRSAPTS